MNDQDSSSLMIITPRSIDVPSGSQSAEFKIRNLSMADYILLFRVRRSNPKLVSFFPKKGVVEPGIAQIVKLKLVDPQITSARILVKIIAIPRLELQSDFRQSWDKGMHKHPIVKKVVEIKNCRFSFTGDDDMSFSMASGELTNEIAQFQQYTNGTKNISTFQGSQGSSARNRTSVPQLMLPTDDMLSPAKSVYDNICKGDDQSYSVTHCELDGVHDSSPGVVASVSHRLHDSGGNLDSAETTSNNTLLVGIGVGIGMALGGTNSDVSRNTVSMIPDSDMIHKLASALKDSSSTTLSSSQQQMQQQQQYRQQTQHAHESERSILFGDNNDNSNSYATISGHPEFSRGDDSRPPVSRIEASVLHGRSGVPERTVEMSAQSSSNLVLLNSGSSGTAASALTAAGSQPCLLEMQGHMTSNTVVAAALKLRLGHALLSDRRVVSVEISHSPLTSLRESLCSMYQQFLDNSRSGVRMDSTSREAHEMNRMRNVVLTDNLQHLTITSCQALSKLDMSVNFLSRLYSLNLSNNNLRTLEGPLKLTYLQYLNLSFNKLTTLDFLQQLLALRSLNVSSNELATLHASVNMLVPLAGQLTVLDLSNNPVCQQLRYAEAVLDILPRIRHFDGKDLKLLTKSYVSSQQHRNKSRPPVVAASESWLATNDNHSTTSEHSGTGSYVAMFDDNMHSDRDRQSEDEEAAGGHRSREQVSKEDVDFENRLRRALKRHEGSSASVSAVASSAAKRAGGGDAGSTPSRISSQGLSPTSFALSQIGTPARSPGPGHSSTGRGAHNSMLASANRGNTATAVSLQQHNNQYNHAHRKQQGHHEPPPLPSYSQPQYQQHQQYNQQESHQPETQSDHITLQQASATASRPANQMGPSSASSYMVATNSSKGRIKSQTTCLIPHWAGQDPTTADPEVPTEWKRHDPDLGHHSDHRPAGAGKTRTAASVNHDWMPSTSRLLQTTGATRSRRKSFGMFSSLDNDAAALAASGESAQNCYPFDSKGYHSDGDLSGGSSMLRSHHLRQNVTGGSQTSQTSAASSNIRRCYPGKRSEQVADDFYVTIFKEMQEDPRYGIWHPRYRVPKPIFGFSKPFAHRPEPNQASRPPQFAQSIERMRDSFEKLPSRGTFTRASKGLVAEWYPMDYTDVESIRRQGYFHQTIGDRPNIVRTAEPLHEGTGQGEPTSGLGHSNNSTMSMTSTDKRTAAAAEPHAYYLNQTNLSVSINKGSVTLSPKKGRRSSLGQHMSRQYQSTDGRLEDLSQSHARRMSSSSAASATSASDDFSSHRKWYTSEIAAQLDTSSNSGQGNNSFSRGGGPPAEDRRPDVSAEVPVRSQYGGGRSRQSSSDNTQDLHQYQQQQMMYEGGDAEHQEDDRPQNQSQTLHSLASSVDYHASYDNNRRLDAAQLSSSSSSRALGNDANFGKPPQSLIVPQPGETERNYLANRISNSSSMSKLFGNPSIVDNDDSMEHHNLSSRYVSDTVAIGQGAPTQSNSPVFNQSAMNSANINENFLGQPQPRHKEEQQLESYLLWLEQQQSQDYAGLALTSHSQLHKGHHVAAEDTATSAQSMRVATSSRDHDSCSQDDTNTDSTGDDDEQEEEEQHLSLHTSPASLSSQSSEVLPTRAHIQQCPQILSSQAQSHLPTVSAPAPSSSATAHLFKRISSTDQAPSPPPPLQQQLSHPRDSATRPEHVPSPHSNNSMLGSDAYNPLRTLMSGSHLSNTPSKLFHNENLHPY